MPMPPPTSSQVVYLVHLACLALRLEAMDLWKDSGEPPAAATTTTTTTISVIGGLLDLYFSP